MKNFCALGLTLGLTALLTSGLTAQTPTRLVVAGKGAPLVVDALFTFPSLRPLLASSVKPDQGFGLFLSVVDPGFTAKATLDKNAGAETYAAAKGDLYLLKSTVKVPLGASIEALGLKTLYLDLESPEGFYRDLANLGSALGAGARAAEVTAYYKGLQADTEKRVAGLAKPKVLLAQSVDNGQAWDVAPANWMQARLVEMAGGTNVGQSERGAGWTRVGAEQIAVWNPEVVIVVSYSADAAGAAKAFRSDPRFAQTVAVKAGAVHAMAQDFYSWDQADTRWILGLRRIASFLHPDRFADVDAGAEARRFFEFLYGVNPASFDTSIRPQLKGEHGVP